MSSEHIDVLIIFLTLISAVICMVVLTIFRLRLSKAHRQSRKSYAALLIDAEDNVDMIIPIIEQKPVPIEYYSRMIQTETIHPSVETDPDYFHSILSNDDQPYYVVREIQFASCERTPTEVNIHMKKGHHLIDHQQNRVGDPC